MSDRVPMPIRSLMMLSQGQPAATALPIRSAGTTYTMAQEAAFLDDRHYAVGRWDGTLSLFVFTDSPTQGPLIAKAVNSPAHEGVQMIVPLGSPASAFASSNDEESVLIWTAKNGAWSDLAIATTLSFDSALGVANSGATVTSNGKSHLVVGHANGFVSIWRQADWTCTAAIDARAAKPVNPWGLHNIRGVAKLELGDGLGYVVTGSEDGNLTVIRVSDGAILSATLYSPDAQRGINSVAAAGATILVANCAVGPADFNLWSYAVDPANWSVTLADKTILRINSSAPQVFNFDVVFAQLDGGATGFFCSTEDGALWMGRTDPEAKIAVDGHQPIGAALGSALCIAGPRLAATAYDLHEFLIS
jgi:hypothetical protein